MVNQNDKLKKVIKYFEKIQKLFPDNNMNLNIHSIDMKDLDYKIWHKHYAKLESGREYSIAERIGKGDFDISLFD